jgi:ATP-dependent DNA helicase RecQ
VAVGRTADPDENAGGGRINVPMQPSGASAVDAVKTQAAEPAVNEPYPLHSTVRHKAWGTGTVLGYDNDRMTVLFDTVGYKTLSLAVVRTGGLLVLEAD